LKFKLTNRLPQIILHVGLAVVAATFVYIFFYSAEAVDSGRLSRLDLVAPMIEHAVVSLLLLIGGVWLLGRVAGSDADN